MDSKQCLVTNNVLTKVFHFDGKAIVEEYIRDLGIPATFIILGLFMHWLGFFLQPVSTSSTTRSYKLSIPIPSTSRIPVISAASSTGLYVKSILLNRERVLGKEVFAAEGWYSFDDLIKVFKEEAGLDIVFEQCSEVEYKAAFASKGLPEFFQEDMVENMKWTSDWGFFGDKQGVLEEGHQVSANYSFSPEWTRAWKEIC